MKRSPMKPRKKPMRRRSKKMAHEYEKEGGRRDVVAHLLATIIRCEFRNGPRWGDDRRCSKPADDVHEILPRSAGGSITDPANTVCLCRHHHRRVHEHPAWSRANGWLKSRYDAPTV